MSYNALRASNRRLSILQFLEGEADYRMNSGLLHTLLTQIGDAVSDATLQNDAAWLAEAGCLVIEKLTDVTIFEITQRGVEVATGLARLDGVARPKPRH